MSRPKPYTRFRPSPAPVGTPLAAQVTVRILISNDDGIYSPGLAALAQVASEFGEVRVVAPDGERSSTGHAVTHTRPLSYRESVIDGFEAYRVDGTPADCVALGAHLWGDVDLVLSGVNIGLNLGNSMWHSGTLAAAKQATLLGLRGVALSAPSSAASDFAPYKFWMRKAIETILPQTELRLLNINIPKDPKGLLWTKVSVRQYDGYIVPTKNPMGQDLYWFTVRPLQAPDEDSDRWAVERDWVSITPLKLDLTDEPTLERVRAKQPLDSAKAQDDAQVEPPHSVHAEEASAPIEHPPV